MGRDAKSEIAVDRTHFESVVRKLLATPPLPKAAVLPRKRAAKKASRPKSQARPKSQR
jgi:hypothetical protein